MVLIKKKKTRHDNYSVNKIKEFEPGNKVKIRNYSNKDLKLCDLKVISLVQQWKDRAFVTVE